MPAHARHVDIGQQYMNRSRVILALDDGIFRASGLQDVIAETFKDFPREAAHCVFIPGKQDGFRTARHWEASLGIPVNIHLLPNSGKVDFESGSLARL